VTRGTTAATIALVAPVGAVAAPPPAFDWRPLDDAERYRVAVFSADGLPVWTSPDVAAPPVAWPAGVAAAAGAYRWKVEALRGGVTIAESPLGAFQIP
jgi:hypothetical protein